MSQTRPHSNSGSALRPEIRVPALRSSEWLLCGYFAYVALISPFFRDRPNLRFQPFLLCAVVWLFLVSLSACEQQSRFTHLVGYIRDWLPILLTFVAFREMELFLPPSYDHGYEAVWARSDHIFLATWHARSFIESLGKLIPFCLEACYFLVYGLPAYCLGVLYARAKRRSVDRFLLIYLTGTLTAYALFPYFPSQPPRLVFPGVDEPTYTTWVRQLNLFVLSKATIHVGVFPSAHVSSAFSAAWALFLLMPRRKIFGYGLLVYAVGVSIATIYGRYHYSADVLSGFALSLLAAALCLGLRPLTPDRLPT